MYSPIQSHHTHTHPSKLALFASSKICSIQLKPELLDWQSSAKRVMKINWISLGVPQMTPNQNLYCQLMHQLIVWFIFFFCSVSVFYSTSPTIRAHSLSFLIKIHFVRVLITTCLGSILSDNWNKSQTFFVVVCSVFATNSLSLSVCLSVSLSLSLSQCVCLWLYLFLSSSITLWHPPSTLIRNLFVNRWQLTEPPYLDWLVTNSSPHSIQCRQI